MPPKNPWTNICWRNTIADYDKCSVFPFLVGCNHPNIEQQIHNELLPEPFLGDFRANVYLLNGNPKFTDKDYLFVGDKNFEKKIQHTLNQDLTGAIIPFIWLDKTTPVSKGRRNQHPGYRWWMDKMKNAIQYMKSTLRINRIPNICCIEYYPYISKKMPSLPILLSDMYVDYYINDAIIQDKWIVVMFHYKEWLKRIPALRHYPKLLKCSSQRNVIISQRNLINVAAQRKINTIEWDQLIKSM